MHIVGSPNIADCIRELKRTQELLEAACQEAAEALACLSKPRVQAVRDREQKELLKGAKLCVREVVFWCCTAKVIGLDSRPALLRCFPDACRRTDHEEENLVSQLANAYGKHSGQLASASNGAALAAACSAVSRSSQSGVSQQSADVSDVGDDEVVDSAASRCQRSCSSSRASS